MAAPLFLLSLVTVLFTALPLFFNPRFYFLDDFESYYLPGFLEIARLIKMGNLPFVSPLTWVGGHLAGEYQYGLFNPLLAFLYVLLGSLPLTYAAYATLFVGFFHWFNGVAFFCLARRLGLTNWLAMAAALSLQGSAFYLYWYSTTWITGVSSLGFLIWSVNFTLKSLGEKRIDFRTVLSVFGLLTAGNNQSVYAYLVFLLILTGVSRRSAWTAIRSAALAFCLALPALVPLFERGLNSTRRGQGVFWFFTREIPNLLLSGVPALSAEKLFAPASLRHRTVDYLVWYLPLLLTFLLSPSFFRRLDRTEKALVLTALFLLIQLCLPLPFAMTISARLLPAFLIFATVAVLPALAKRGVDPFRDKSRTVAVLAATLAGLWWQRTAGSAGDLVIVAIIAGFFLVLRKIPWTSPAGGRVFLAGVAGVSALMIFLQPKNQGVSDPQMHGRQTAGTPPALGWNWFLNHGDFIRPFHGKNYCGANGLILTGERWINGYSPFPLREHLFQANHYGSMPPAAVAPLAKPLPQGLSLLEFAGVNRLTFLPNSFDRYAGILKKPEWRLVKRHPFLQLERKQNVCRTEGGPLCVSFASPQFQLESAWDKNTEFGLTVSNPGKKGTLIVAKPWYPGLRLFLNEQETPYVRLQGMVPVVPIPENFRGTVRFSYLSRAWIFSCGISALAIAAWLAITVWRHFAFPVRLLPKLWAAALTRKSPG